MIDPKHNCIFIHIPKTAGSFIEVALMDGREKDKVDLSNTDLKKVMINYIRNGHVCMKVTGVPEHLATMKHWPHRSYIKHVDRSEKYFKFAFVRNPWSRLHSLYNYMRCEGKNLYVRNNNFNQWIELLGKYSGTWRMRNLLGYAPYYSVAQFAFLRPVERLDFIGKIENLKSDFSYVMKEIGIDSSKVDFNKKINKSKKVESPWDAYTDKAKEIVQRLCQRDIDHWEYEFGK